MSSKKPHPLDKIFHPKSIAIIGASASAQAIGWPAMLVDFGYAGHLYPVNPRAAEISGLKAYPTVRDIPGPVDYAIFNIPARLTPQIMEDCAAKGVKVAHIYTAGFSEMGTEEGKKLEEQVAAIAKEGGVRVIGPNCMGIYYPAAGLTFRPNFSNEPGNVSFVSQTGAGAARFIYLANDRGIHFSKVISYGNAIDLDTPDFLEYLAGDKETEIIACYIEGVKDGRRFLEAVRKCLVTKPVVVLKAGLTESGAGAAASHTASLAGSKSVWDAFFKQTGAISVDTLEEIVDVILALLRMPCPKGQRVGIVGRGGGIGVIATDTCERAGLKVPPFLPETRRQLEEIVPEAGAGVRNPVETAPLISGAADFYALGLKIVDADPQIDFILTHMAVDVSMGHQPDLQEEIVSATEVLASIAQTLTKPIAVVLYAGEHLETVTAVLEARKRLLEAGISVYPTIEAAAKAVSKLIGYHEFTEKR
ncbi:acetate--CoA ligase family protein [Chloroflexota bacterium]